MSPHMLQWRRGKRGRVNESISFLCKRKEKKEFTCNKMNILFCEEESTNIWVTYLFFFYSLFPCLLMLLWIFSFFRFIKVNSLVWNEMQVIAHLSHVSMYRCILVTLSHWHWQVEWCSWSHLTIEHVLCYFFCSLWKCLSYPWEMIKGHISARAFFVSSSFR